MSFMHNENNRSFANNYTENVKYNPKVNLCGIQANFGNILGSILQSEQKRSSKQKKDKNTSMETNNTMSHIDENLIKLMNKKNSENQKNKKIEEAKEKNKSINSKTKMSPKITNSIFQQQNKINSEKTKKVYEHTKRVGIDTIIPQKNNEHTNMQHPESKLQNQYSNKNSILKSYNKDQTSTQYSLNKKSTCVEINTQKESENFQEYAYIDKINRENLSPADINITSDYILNNHDDTQNNSVIKCQSVEGPNDRRNYHSLPRNYTSATQKSHDKGHYYSKINPKDKYSKMQEYHNNSFDENDINTIGFESYKTKLPYKNDSVGDCRNFKNNRFVNNKNIFNSRCYTNPTEHMYILQEKPHNKRNLPTISKSIKNVNEKILIKNEEKIRHDCLSNIKPGNNTRIRLCELNTNSIAKNAKGMKKREILNGLFKNKYLNKTVNECDYSFYSEEKQLQKYEVFSNSNRTMTEYGNDVDLVQSHNEKKMRSTNSKMANKIMKNTIDLKNNETNFLSDYYINRTMDDLNIDQDYPSKKKFMPSRSVNMGLFVKNSDVLENQIKNNNNVEILKQIKNSTESVLINYIRPIHKKFYNRAPQQNDIINTRDYSYSSHDDINNFNKEDSTKKGSKILNKILESETDLANTMGIFELKIEDNNIEVDIPRKFTMIEEDSKEYENSKVQDVTQSFGPKYTKIKHDKLASDTSEITEVQIYQPKIKDYNEFSNQGFSIEKNKQFDSQSIKNENSRTIENSGSSLKFNEHDVISSKNSPENTSLRGRNKIKKRQKIGDFSLSKSKVNSPEKNNDQNIFVPPKKKEITYRDACELIYKENKGKTVTILANPCDFFSVYKKKEGGDERNLDMQVRAREITNQHKKDFHTGMTIRKRGTTWTTAGDHSDMDHTVETCKQQIRKCYLVDNDRWKTLEELNEKELIRCAKSKLDLVKTSHVVMEEIGEKWKKSGVEACESYFNAAQMVNEKVNNSIVEEKQKLKLGRLEISNHIDQKITERPNSKILRKDGTIDEKEYEYLFDYCKNEVEKHAKDKLEKEPKLKLRTQLSKITSPGGNNASTNNQNNMGLNSTNSSISLNKDSNYPNQRPTDKSPTHIDNSTSFSNDSALNNFGSEDNILQKVNLVNRGEGQEIKITENKGQHNVSPDSPLGRSPIGRQRKFKLEIFNYDDENMSPQMRKYSESPTRPYRDYEGKPKVNAFGKPEPESSPQEILGDLEIHKKTMNQIILHNQKAEDFIDPFDSPRRKSYCSPKNSDSPYTEPQHLYRYKKNPTGIRKKGVAPSLLRDSSKNSIKYNSGNSIKMSPKNSPNFYVSKYGTMESFINEHPEVGSILNENDKDSNNMQSLVQGSKNWSKLKHSRGAGNKLKSNKRKSVILTNSINVLENHSQTKVENHLRKKIENHKVTKRIYAFTDSSPEGKVVLKQSPKKFCMKEKYKMIARNRADKIKPLPAPIIKTKVMEQTSSVDLSKAPELPDYSKKKSE